MSNRKPPPHLRPLLDDTDAEARRVLVHVYREMSAERKATIIGQLRHMTRQLFDAGYRARHPNATADEMIDAWLHHMLEPELYEKVRSYRDELARRRLERSAESGATAGANAGDVRARRIAGELGARCSENDQ
jgi:hypothetical protein